MQVICFLQAKVTYAEYAHFSRYGSRFLGLGAWSLGANKTILIRFSSVIKIVVWGHFY